MNQLTYYRCKNCRRYFEDDTQCDDGFVNPDHPMKVLVESFPAGIHDFKILENFECDLDDCAAISKEFSIDAQRCAFAQNKAHQLHDLSISQAKLIDDICESGERELKSWERAIIDGLMADFKQRRLR